MRTRISILIVTLGLCAAVASPALAMQADQQKPPQPSGQKPAPQTTKPKAPPAPKLPIGFRVFGGYEATQMAAKESFKAQTGSAMVPGFVVGADILNLWKRIFVRVGLSSGSVDGTRGFVDESNVFISNGVPLKMGIKNLELGVGWRSYMKKHPRMAWYVGAGMSKISHSQESPDADGGLNDTESGTGYMGLFGLEFALKKEVPARPLKRQFFAGVEAQMRSAKNVLGSSGSSLAFGEDNAGGLAVRGLFGIRFKK